MKENEREEYVRPEAEVISLAQEDVIVASSGNCENYFYYPWKNYGG